MTTTPSLPWPRKKWFKVSCCPPNIVKTWGLLGSVQFSALAETVAVHLYFGADFTTKISGADASIKVESGFPFSGNIKISTSFEKSFELALRIPGWSRGNYKASAEGREKDGYLYVKVPSGSFEMDLDFPMEPRFMYAHPRTRKDEVAIVRGPLVYCAESPDNDFDLEAAYVSDQSKISESVQSELASVRDVPVLEVPCKVKKGLDDWSAELYSTQPPQWEDGHTLKFVPYFLRGNRGGSGAMRVWMGRSLSE